MTQPRLRSIDKHIDVPAAAARVWEAWTTREGILSFLAPDARVEARVGGPFEIYFDPFAPAGHRGADDMRFMALQPPVMLSFDWNAPPDLAEARDQRTFVMVRLAAVSAELTHVHLHHTGWGDGGQWDEAFAYFDRAWGFVLHSLRDRFEHGPVDWVPRLEQLRASHIEAAPAAPGSAPGATK